MEFAWKSRQFRVIQWLFPRIERNTGWQTATSTDVTGIGYTCGAADVRASNVPDNSKRAERVHPKDVSCTSTSGADVIPRVYPENRMHVACAQSITTFATCAMCHERKKYACTCLPLSLSLSLSISIYLSLSLSVSFPFHLSTCWFARLLERGAQSPMTAKTAGNAYRLLWHCAWILWHR